jgi:hypothetical protein
MTPAFIEAVLDNRRAEASFELGIELPPPSEPDPDTYASRFVSAEKLVADFRSHRVAAEIEIVAGQLETRAERFELDVHQLAADLAHFAQVLGLDDVARLRVDRDRAARARAVGDVLRKVREAVRRRLAGRRRGVGRPSRG